MTKYNQCTATVHYYKRFDFYELIFDKLEELKQELHEGHKILSIIFICELGFDR